MDEIESNYEQAMAVKNHIVRANLRLVVSIAKRHVKPTDNFFELVSDGNMSLIRAVEKFDYARGNKFSTYASWAIMKNFARTIPKEYKQRDRFRTSFDEMFMATEDWRTNPYLQESRQAIARIPDWQDHVEPRRSRTTDHFGPLWFGSQPGTTDAERGRGELGRDQGTDTPD